MISMQLSIALILSSATSTWAGTSLSNITIAFTKGEAETCDAFPQSPGFTTWVVPEEGLSGGCYNLDDIFSDKFPFFSTIPHPNTTQQAQADLNILNGSTFNSHSYDGQLNYTHVWYQQTTDLNHEDSAKLAIRELIIYPERDCHTAHFTPDGGADSYQMNCRTDEDGRCYSHDSRIESFSISYSSKDGNDKGKSCLDGKAVGGASAFAHVHVGSYGVIAIGMAAALLSAM